MSRKQRIIVSITGIVLVSLILIGLTYGYYMTKINGNTNSKSISVVTANLLLEYADVNDELITDSAVEPGKTWTKTFVATNKGNKAVTYGVALENVVNQFERKDDIVYTLDCKQYSKTGFSIDKTNKTVTGTISGTCNGVSDETTFPSIGTILVENDIADDKAQVYTLTITYKEMNVDQSVDMNKTFSAKANIVDPNNFKPYGEGTLATAIIDSAKNNEIYRTVYMKEPLTNLGKMISKYKTGKKVLETIKTSDLCFGYSTWLVGDSVSAAQNGTEVNSYEEAVGKYVYDQCAGWTKKLIKYDSTTDILTFDNYVDEYIYERTLSKTQDDYGDSYYFRGDVIDNYVNFAGMCWRIVRIEGDGSIKLILASESSCNSDNVTTTSGYATNSNAKVLRTEYQSLTKLYAGEFEYTLILNDYLNSTYGTKAKLRTWLEEKIVDDTDKALLKNDNWCIGDTTSAYDDSGNLLSSTSEELINNTTNNFLYSSGKRMTIDKYFTLKCNGNKEGEVDVSNIGMLTADEVIFAGGIISSESDSADMPNYYLVSQGGYCQTLSHQSFSCNVGICGEALFSFTSAGILNANECVDFYSTNIRPVITLVSNIQITSGDGTVNNAYVVKTS